MSEALLVDLDREGDFDGDFELPRLELPALCDGDITGLEEVFDKAVCRVGVLGGGGTAGL